MFSALLRLLQASTTVVRPSLPPDARVHSSELDTEQIAADQTLALHRQLLQEQTLRMEAERLSEAKSKALATVSHEVRTPLNGLLGMAALMLETPLNEEQRDYTKAIRDSAESLLTIVNGILDFAKLEAGKLELDSIETDIRELVRQATELFAPLVSSRGLKLEISVDERLPRKLVGDPARLRQVLLNFLSNAVKFTSQGGIRVNICYQPPETPESKSRVRFSIVDTGIGIAEDVQRRLFENFSQADASISRKYGGTGLGLAISRQLVELMGGAIGVESDGKTGSTFWFDLDMPVYASSEAARTEAADAIPAHPVRKSNRECLLVVEDNSINQKVAVQLLRRLGFTVCLAANGAEAVEQVKTQRFQAILMDCHMPVMDGYEATSAIRTLEGLAHRTPIIAVTAYTLDGQQERCIAVGMDDFLPKPVTRESLEAVLEKWLFKTTAEELLAS